MIALLLFIGSGFSALVYEIVWFQVLQLVIGSSARSIGTLLGTFMGGMCLGSLLLPKVVSKRFHPLKVYAVLEILIGACGLALLYLMPAIANFYSEQVQGGQSAFLIRSAICALAMTIPTMLMGATLPAIARWVESTPQGLAKIGWFYAFNIIGAVAGCTVAGFYLLRVHDVVTATIVAASVNLVAAVIAFALARQVNYENEETVADESPSHLPVNSLGIYLAICLSGLTALACEVIWTRLLSLILGATVYTFSIILAVFLVGLGIGSSIGSVISRSQANSRIAFALCQLGLVPAILWSAYSLTQSIPYWPIDVRLTSSPWMNFQLDLVRAAWAMLPSSILWGASFPLALSSLASSQADSGKLVARVYAANTLGAIIGALTASLVMVSGIGTLQSQQILIVLAGLSSIAVFLSLKSEDSTSNLWLHISAVFLILIIAGSAAFVVPRVPDGLIAYGRLLPTYSELPEFLDSSEGLNASIAVSEFEDGIRNFHVSGKVVASSDPLDMRLQRMLAHLPALIHPEPKSVLIVGCGAGVTAGTFVIHPEIERIVICEIEPTIPPAAGKHFADENFSVISDDRLEIVIDDARHYMATADEKFDIITSDPIHPWVKGASSLYSREYFELCKNRLKPGGVVTQWVPLYESNEAAVKSQVATFLEAFPGGTIWSNDDLGLGYDVVLLGQNEATRIDVQELHQRLARPDHQQVRESLQEVDFNSDLDLILTYAGQERDLKEWLADAVLNTDRNMRLQYLAGLGINEDQSEAIFDSMVRYRKYPDNVFTATPASESLIRGIFKRNEIKYEDE